MIVLDTNVVSALARGEAGVVRWYRGVMHQRLALAATSVMEIAYGIERLPLGARRSEVEQQWQEFEDLFAKEILPLDEPSARMAGVIMAKCAVLGRPIGIPDAQIAATVLLQGGTLATRNIRDFEGLGLTLVDPWVA